MLNSNCCALQEAIAPQIAGKPIPGADPAEFVFYLDENCEHATEVLVHSWLDLHECSIETCLIGELLVGGLQNGPTVSPAPLPDEINTTKPVDILQVSCCQCRLRHTESPPLTALQHRRNVISMLLMCSGLLS